MSSMSSQHKRVKQMTENNKICSLCQTLECFEWQMSEESAKESGELPLKDIIGPHFESVPNEVIYLILKNISFTDLSKVSILNKWFRNFILQHFIESKTGLISLLGSNYLSTNAKTAEQQRQRIHVFFDLGLLLKRVSCLLPTAERIDLMFKVIYTLDAIPTISSNPLENQRMRFVFQCYGQLIRHFVSGWDDSELKTVFKALQTKTEMEAKILIVSQNPFGARNTVEYYIRSFFRMVCFDPNKPIGSENRSDSDDDRLFWLKSVLHFRSIKEKARLLLIVFGPLISQSPIPTSIPYIGYWDLTDTFFIHSGLEDLGDAIRLLYTHSNSSQKRKNVILLMEEIMRTPTIWLSENVAALMFYAGDEITFDYLFSQLEMENYSEVAQKIVFLTLVSHKLTKQTKTVYTLIEELASDKHKSSLYNEIPIAFIEAINDVENAIELEDERDVCELHDIISAYSDLFRNYMFRPSITSSADENLEKSEE